MRLGQLARKLELRPNEIIEFLTSKEIIIDSSNARLADEHVTLIVQYFAPGKEELITLDATTPDATITREDEEISLDLQPSNAVAEMPVVAVDVTPNEPVDLQDEEPLALPDIIKAQKIELTGLKIVGKIDLPEPKKKEDVAVPADQTGSEQPEQQVVNRIPKREAGRSYRKENADESRPRKNPIALQREREASDIEKKKRTNAAEAKEQRTKNYLKKVKPAVPTKAARLVTEPLEASSNDAESKPASLLNRLLRWLKQP